MQYVKGQKVLVTTLHATSKPVVDVVSEVKGESVWITHTTLNGFYANTGLERRKGRAAYRIQPATPEEIDDYAKRCETDRLCRIVETYLWSCRSAGVPTDALRDLALIAEKVGIR